MRFTEEKCMSTLTPFKADTKAHCEEGTPGEEAQVCSRLWKMLAHAEGKKTCPAERSPKDCFKTLNTFLLPWPSIGNSSENSSVLSGAGKTDTAMKSAQLPKTATAVQITGFHSLITSHLPNGWSSPIRNGCSHFWAIKTTHSLFCSTKITVLCFCVPASGFILVTAISET